MSTTQPGWYPDPEQPGKERWWDGRSWTDQRRDPIATSTGQGWDAPSGPPSPGGVPSSTADWGSTTPPDQGAYGAGKVSPHGVPLGELGTRLGAFILDLVVAIAVSYTPVIMAFILAAMLSVLGTLGGLLGFLIVMASFVVGIWLAIVMIWIGEGRVGQSYGKHLMNLAVVGRDTGRPIGVWPAFGRGLVRGVAAYPLGLGLLWAAWDKQRQGWHDKALSTLVIKHHATRMSPIAFAKHVMASKP